MSSDKLVIVESPAKARTIGRMLGGGYKILASMGHVRDLPEHSFGVDIENKFTPQYQENKGRGKILKQLKAEAKGVDEIYLAPDPDREGEAIAWHLQEVLKKSTKADFHRVTFHEITKSAINRAFEHSSHINMDLVDSQQARRILDRLVGYMISPLLWSRIEKGISAGRVQSVALRLVCEREREIQAFVPQEYWNFIADLEALNQGSGKKFSAKLAKINGDKFLIDNKADADAALNAIKTGGPFSVRSVEVKPRRRHAPPPFITSTMQQAASTYLGYAASATMRIAQQLYEGVESAGAPQGGLITYMRTDSVNIAKEAQASCLNFIADAYGKDYVPEKPNFYKSKDSAQEAHEAIRPTDVFLTPEHAARFLEGQQLRLYTLVWKRFVASQMSSLQQKLTVVETGVDGSDGKDYLFRTTATVTTFPGYTKVLDLKSSKDEDSDAPAILAELKKDDPCFMLGVGNEQKFTEPPSRFSEAALIRELEANGIGRPSTYASIIQTILGRKYVLKQTGSLVPTELGFKVNDFLVESLPDLFQVGFTASMEDKLDKIEDGQIEWTQMLDEFYKNFAVWLDKAKHIGAPDESKASSLLSLFTNMKWEEPEKRAGRRYDDESFHKSIQDKFDKNGKISERQWLALLQLAVKYQDQIPVLRDEATRHGYLDELETAAGAVREAEKRRQELAENQEEKKEDLNMVFVKMEAVKWEEATTKNKRTYDDQKFFKSLRKQYEAGKPLSEKQINALGRLLSKYSDQIEGANELVKTIGAAVPEEAAQPADPKQEEEINKMLAFLGGVTDWAEPTKRGRRVYDDKEFFQSLSSQREKGKRLSPRQFFALKKLVGKYEKRTQSADTPDQTETAES